MSDFTMKVGNKQKYDFEKFYSDIKITHKSNFILKIIWKKRNEKFNEKYIHTNNFQILPL